MSKATMEEYRVALQATHELLHDVRVSLSLLAHADIYKRAIDVHEQVKKVLGVDSRPIRSKAK